MKEEEIIYSSRDNYKIRSTKILDALREMMDATIYKQIAPVMSGFINTGNFLPFRAFANWNSGYNEFKLEVIGNNLPPVNRIPPEAFFENISDYAEILIEGNLNLIALISNEMNKQNITGKGEIIETRGLVGFADVGFCFEIVWLCFPAGCSSESFGYRLKMQRNAANN